MVQHELNMWDQSETHTLALPRSSIQDTTVYIKLAIQLHSSNFWRYVNVLAGFKLWLVTQN